jgi:hypothetical protein
MAGPKLDDDLRVATARGPGAGRFLALSLTEALASGIELVEVVDSPRPPPGARRGIDFVFGHPETEEVVRAGLDDGGRVVSAELLRRPRRASSRGHAIGPELLSMLRDADLITSLRWDDDRSSEDPALLVTVQSLSQVRFPVGLRA